MITKAAAADKIQKWLDSLGTKHGGWVLVPSMTIERPYGWLFYRATRDYLKSRNIFDMPAGNSAMLCFRDAGEFLFVGTAMRSEHYLSEYEKDPELFLRRFRFVHP